MKRIFSIFVATLLLSTTLLAQNVATLGSQGYTKANFAQAISDWATNGGELTLNEDCEYNATATVTIAKNATLNLNGKTLTWNVDGAKKVHAITINGGQLTIKDDTKAGKLSFLFTNMASSQYGIYSKGTGAERLVVENATIECDVQAAEDYASTAGIKAMAINMYNGSISVTNSTILIKNSCTCGVQAYTNVCLEKFEHNTIRYEGYTTSKIPSSDFRGVYIYRYAKNNNVTFNNCTIDMSRVPVEYDSYSSKNGWSKANTTIYGLYAQGSFANKGNVITIEGGEYKIPTNTKSSAAYVIRQYSDDYVTIQIKSGTFESSANGIVTGIGGIDGGSFKPCPDVKYAKDGYHFELQKDGYYTLVEGAPLFSVAGVPYFTEDDLKKYTKGETVELFTTGSFTIPAETNINLNVHDATANYSVINKGNVTITAPFGGSFTNDGTLTIGAACSAGEFINNASAIINTAAGTCKKMTNKGTLNIGGTAATKQAGDFTKSTLVNSGTLVVSAGTYTAQQYNDLIKNNIVNSYHGWAIDATKQVYKIASETANTFEVNEVGYTKFSDALKQSTKATPVIVHKNYDLKNGSYTISDGKDYYIDLNGKTLTIPAAKNNLVVSHGGLTISGTGKVVCLSHFSISLKGHATEPNYTRLTIGEGITLTNGTYVNKYILMLNEAPFGGIVVNFNGKMVANANNKWCHGFYVNGDQTATTNAPIFNIGEKAEITIERGFGAYAAGYAKWNFAGKIVTDTCGIEIRGGELTMNGGSIEATMGKPADDHFNGNGSTSQACGIAVCQHSTKLPINVVVNDGYIKAYTPLYQSNPQNNETDMKQINLTVNGGKFFSTSKNIVYSLNKRIVLKGGVYNMNPSAYAAEGKVVVANTDEATKDMYPYTIGDVKTGVTFQTAGEWSNAANWSAAATAETPVTIAANVTIGKNVKAEAYGITVAEGKTITIQKGGMLVVGKQGVAGITSADQLVIEDGASLLISPAAIANNQPLATVVRTMNTQKKADGTYEEDDSPYVRYYMGIPTVGQPAISSDKALYVRDWDAATGWKDATEFKTIFKGYGVTSIELNEQASFSGQLIGNTDACLVMPRKGFHFFANGWMAPMDMYEVLNQLDQLKNNGSVEAAVTVCVAEGQYQDLNHKQLYQYPEWEQVAPLNTYFLHANKATTINLNYEKAVWNVQLAKKSAAQKRVAEDDNNAVRIKLMAANNRQDNVYIYDGEEFHSTKMMNTGSNVNIFVEKDENNYSTFASEDLEGTVIGIQTNSQTNYSLTFDFVKGKTLYIKDLQTSVVTAMTEGNVYNFTANPKETSRRFMVTYNTPTSLDNAVANTAAKGVYSITGQYLGDRSVLETLPQGIYVVDGQKYCK